MLLKKLEELKNDATEVGEKATEILEHINEDDANTDI